MKLFSTQRQIRNWLSSFNNSVLEKHLTIGDFLQKIIIVEGKKFIDKEIRNLYLFEVIQNIDIEKFGFKKEFLSFTKNSEFIFGFFQELFMEQVDINNVILSDTYIEYEEHLIILNEIKQKYADLLEQNGYIDTFLIKEYEINSKILEDVEEIEIFLDGYLSKFDCEILSKIDKKIIINVEISQFNRYLISKFLLDLNIGYRYKIDFHTKQIISKQQLIQNSNIEINYFSKRFDEINFVFAKIAEFVESGIKADKIAVILPDETFSEFLEEFDKYRNLNFAMGKSIMFTQFYIKLKSIYEFLMNKDELNLIKAGEWIEEFENSDDILKFIRDKASNKELQLIDEELFKLSKFKNIFDDKKQFLYFILEKLKQLSFDDSDGGKITVMGVLESRGMVYDGVILIDFNDGLVPNINSKDLFLNSSIRKKAHLPTRMDKENLQKHYYYSLIHNSKFVAISYVNNETQSASRFLYEMNMDLGENKDEKYKNVLYNFSKKKEITYYDETFEIFSPLTPTTLKMLLECPKKYYFSKILKIKNIEEENENFGTIFHNSIEEIVKNKDFINSKKEYFDVLMDKIFSTLKSKTEVYKFRIKYEDMIKKFCELDYEQMKYSENIVEKWLKNFECNNIELLAKVDRIDLLENSITLIDYKTGNIKNLLKHPYEFQLTFYYLWAKKNYPEKNIRVFYWDISEAKMVESSPKIELLKEKLSYLPTKVEMAKDIKVDEKVVIKAFDICKWCEYNVACGRG